MIPKIIHYCWFGHGEKSLVIQRCIESWYKYLPDYSFKCWDESNYDIANAPKFVQEAYLAKKWAFVADYVRMEILYLYGGTYLDTDVEVRKSLTQFLHHRFFIGNQSYPIDIDRYTKGKRIYLSMGVIGCEPNHPYWVPLIEYYKTSSFLSKEGDPITTTTNVKMTEQMVRYGYKPIDEKQNLAEGIVLYPSSIFADRTNAEDSENCFTFHWGEMSWFTPKPRGVFYKVCWNLNIMRFYHFVESLRKKSL